jgi:hypothetical protein
MNYFTDHNLFVDHEGHCFYELENVLLKTGEKTHTARCEEISCFDDFSMTIAS